LRIDPSAEAGYRARLAEEYLKRAERFLGSGDYKESVGACQLAVENAAKAVIALRRILSWSHDPSHELLELLNELPEQRALAVRLAELAHEVAPEHGMATYGRPGEGLTP